MKGTANRILPLEGLTVLVTRPQEQARRLTDALAAEGASALEVPVIALEPPESWGPLDAAIAADGYDWTIFTSANGVRFFWQRLEAAGRGAEWFEGNRTATIGPETARTLEARGVRPTLVPNEFVAEALVAALADAGPLGGQRILAPRADRTRDALTRGLRDRGAIVDEVVAYRTVRAPAARDLEGHLRVGGIDVVTFTSSSTVRSLLEALDSAESLRGVTIACIGPITAATAREAGLAAHVVAETHTIPGLVAALREYYAKNRSW